MSPLRARFEPWLSRAWRGGMAHRHGVAVLADQGVVSAMNFATGVIIGRTCAKEQFGLYALAFVVITGILDVQTTLISGPYTVYRPRLEPEEARAYTGSTLLFQVAFSLLALVALVGVGRAFRSSDPALAAVLTTTGLAIPFVFAKENLRRVCFASFRMRSALLLDSGVAVIQIACLLLLARAGLLSTTVALVVTAAAAGAMAVTWLFWHRSQYTLAWAPAIASMRSMLTLGRWMSASGLLSNATLQLYPWLLTTLRGSAVNAQWAACGSITSAVNPAILALNNYLGPATATAYATGGARRLRRVVFWSCLLFIAAVVPFCVVMLVEGARIVVFVYGSAYSEAGVLVSLLALGLIPLGLSVVTSRGLFALERADLDFETNLVPFVAVLAAGVWLIPAYGAQGAAMATLVGSVGAAAIRCWLFAAICKGDREPATVTRPPRGTASAVRRPAPATPSEAGPGVSMPAPRISCWRISSRSTPP